MSENVKIKIIEKDNTSPAGSGIDSTDIAFVPGFSILPEAPANIPTLVTSTKEFETLFGKQPRVLTYRDVAKYTDYGFKTGDYDRSYVYAKELLYQGMPVVYSNIVGTAKYSPMPIDAVKEVPESKSLKTTTESNTISCEILDSTLASPVELKISTSFGVAKSDGKNSVITTYELIPDVEGCTASISKIEVDSTNLEGTLITEASYKNIENIVEFVNYSDVDKELTATVTLKVEFDTSVVSRFEIKLKNRTDSLLDAFYATDDKLKCIPVNTQWAIGTRENPVENTISDKSVYSVKYITSGGYPSVVSGKYIDPETNKEDSDKFIAKSLFATDMIAAAENRGDAVALIDYQMASDERVFSTEKNSDTFYAKMHSLFDSDSKTNSYGAAMYPWAIYNCSTALNEPSMSPMISMPASFGYLMCVAKAIKSSPNWLAMAGVTRGLVPGINKLLVPGNAISNAIAEEMQPKFGEENNRLSINTITNIRPYGLTLWGNRTLMSVNKEGTVALNFLNTRNMLSDIKKLLYTTAKSCMFEQNSSDLWIKFKDGIEPLLRRMKAGNGISDYQIVRGKTKYNGDPLRKGEIAAVIKVYPMYAVEYFELAVEINDEEVSVS